MIDDYGNSAKYCSYNSNRPSSSNLRKTKSNYKPPTINIQNIITNKRETFIFENMNLD